VAEQRVVGIEMVDVLGGHELVTDEQRGRRLDDG
jgi:hypothetical protein